MAQLEIKNLSFSYPGQSERALNEVSFTVEEGEFITLCGSSGSGKSTLLRLIKTELSPHGEKSGEIMFDGVLTDNMDGRRCAEKIGFVMQNPDNQIVTDKVWHELAFGMESLGYDGDTMRRRIAEMAGFFGIEKWFHKNVSELSGGQKQLLNLASAMVIEPAVLILDEPTSRLDPIAASDFLAAVGKVNRELGTTVIIAEHRLDEVFSQSSRALVLDGGRLICDDKPGYIAEILKDGRHPMFLSMPAPIRIYSAVPNSLDCPVTIAEGRSWLSEYAKTNAPGALPQREEFGSDGKEPSAELCGVWFRYEKNEPDVLKGLSLKAYPGELLALVGGNGAGKSTAISLLGGINRPYRGKVKIMRKELLQHGSALYESIIGVLPQDVTAVFTQKTVFEDLYGMTGTELTEDGKLEKIRRVTSLCRLGGFLDRHPYDLSGGEQERAALAIILLSDPEILLLDEPTKGMDYEYKLAFGKILTELKKQGKTIIVVSHDLDFCAKYADRCAMIFDGDIFAENETRRFFAGSSFYTTPANRMARHVLPEAVTVEDVVFALGGKIDKPDAGEDERKYEIPTYKEKEKSKEGRKKKIALKKLSRRTIIALIIIAIAIPITIFMGMHFLDARKYYITSILIIFEAMAPFVLIFEGRKPQARELVIIAVMCALATAGRAAFFMLPEFKPVVALVIIAGAALGAETGFLVGAVTAFISNFFFGQGPWTPWQMFALGIIGLIAGLLFAGGAVKSGRIQLTVFGGLAAIIIYGGIMNPASVMMYQENITAGMLIASYAAGFPTDLIHCAATVIFLLILSAPMLEKLKRVKKKFGMLE